MAAVFQGWALVAAAGLSIGTFLGGCASGQQAQAGAAPVSGFEAAAAQYVAANQEARASLRSVAGQMEHIDDLGPAFSQINQAVSNEQVAWSRLNVAYAEGALRPRAPVRLDAEHAHRLRSGREGDAGHGQLPRVRSEHPRDVRCGCAPRRSQRHGCRGERLRQPVGEWPVASCEVSSTKKGGPGGSALLIS